MKILLVGLVIVGTMPIAVGAGKKSVTLELKLEFNHHSISEPRLVVPLGRKSFAGEVMADNAKYVIEVLPRQDIDEQIFLDFTLRKVIHGKSILISHPRIITLNNQKATLDEGDSATSDVKGVVLSVTPHL